MSCEKDINYRGIENQPINITFGNILNRIMSLTDERGDTIDLTGSTFTFKVFGVNFKEATSATVTVDLDTNKFSIAFDATFWGKLSRTGVYTYQLNRIIGGETLTVMSGNFNAA